MMSDAYLAKLGEFTRDPLLVAQFGAMEPHFRFEEVEEHHLAVLINLGGEPSPELRRLKMLWLYLYLMEYVARRDKVVPDVRAWPLSIFIDELTFILGKPGDPNDPLAQDLERLLNLYSRNNNLWVCLTLQEMYQVSEQLQKTLMTLGTQIIGQTTDDETALAFARRFNRYEPLKVKKYEDQWATDIETGEDYIRSKKPIELTSAEQERINADKYKKLSTLRFMVGVSPREGTPATDLSLVDLNDFEQGAYPVLPVVREAQAYFMQRDGKRVVDVLAGIAKRGKRPPPPSGTPAPRPKKNGPQAGGAQPTPLAEKAPLAEETRRDTTLPEPPQDTPPKRPAKRPARPLNEEELTEPL